MNRYVLICALALLGAAPAAGVPLDHTQSITAVKAQAAPPLDASLSSPVWSKALKAAMTENFTNRQPVQSQSAMYLLYDDKYLYAGFHVQQSGIPITATQTVDHAGVMADDHVTLELDTSGNGSRVYTFRASPRGVHDEASTENARYAPEWRSVAAVLPNGDYNVMMQIPLSAMHLQSGSVQHWRINAAEYVARTNDLIEIAYEPTQSDPTLPQYWPWLDGISVTASAARPSPHADVFTLASGGSDHNRFQNGFGSFNPTHARNIGADITVPVTGTLAMVATINPDFSNVEQDQTSIAPQQFARNYSEYRPFFAQGANYINALPQVTAGGITESLFYSPSIGIFDRGVKAEGTLGNSSVGALNVAGAGFNDTALGYAYSTSDQTVRVSAQAVLANHTGVRDDAVGAGIRTRNPHSGIFTIFKDEQDSNSLTGGGHYLFASEGLNSASWFLAADYRDVSENFNPVDGYTALTNIRGPRLGVNYNGVGSRSGIVKTYSIGGMLDRFVDSAGSVKEYDANIGAYVLLQNQLSLQLNTGPSGLRFSDDAADALTPFTLTQFTIGFRDGTPSPLDVSYAWGPFGGAYLQQANASTSQSFGQYSVSLQYGGTVEHASGTDSQWLRRLSVGRSFGRNTTVALSLRDINGRGGYALPGSNISFLFHERFNNGDEFYVDYGTPASQQTLHRLVAKYVFHIGGGSGS